MYTPKLFWSFYFFLRYQYPPTPNCAQVDASRVNTDKEYAQLARRDFSLILWVDVFRLKGIKTVNFLGFHLTTAKNVNLHSNLSMEPAQKITAGVYNISVIAV